MSAIRIGLGAAISGLLGAACYSAFGSGDTAHGFVLLAALLLFWVYIVVAAE